MLKLRALGKAFRIENVVSLLNPIVHSVDDRVPDPVLSCVIIYSYATRPIERYFAGVCPLTPLLPKCGGMGRTTWLERSIPPHCAVNNLLPDCFGS